MNALPWTLCLAASVVMVGCTDGADDGSQAAEDFESAADAARNEHRQTTEAVNTWFESAYEATDSEFQNVVADIQRKYDVESDSLTQKHQDAAWMLDSVYDESATDSPKQQYEAFLTSWLTGTPTVIDPAQ